MWLQLLSLLAVTYAIRRIILVNQKARSISNIPGYRTLFSANSDSGFFLPKIRGINQGRNYAFRDKHSVYESVGCDIAAHISAFPNLVNILVADPAIIKEIVTHRARFRKPVEKYLPLSIFGSNIVASEGDEWKKFRKICAPSFSERNNKLVWDETVSTVNDLLNNVWDDEEQIVLDHLPNIMLPLTLFVISATVFGRKITWNDDEVAPSGHQIPFKDSIATVASNVMQKIMLPNWILPLTRKTRQIDLGFKELRSYMLDFIVERKHTDRNDLLSNLIGASTRESEVEGMSDDELMGNIFIFLIAGHETTAHTLCYSLALLAIYQDEQEKLFQEVTSAVKIPLAPTYGESSLLTRPLAVFYEALRMYPAVTLIPKYSAEDTSFNVTNFRGERIHVPVPKGTYVNIDVVGLHYNPKYWENPFSFHPDRFLQQNWNRDAFLSFSAGARACIGRRFAELEAVAVITIFVARYKITVKDEPQFANETLEQKRDRLLKSTNLLSLTPLKLPLVFTRRS